MERDFFAYTGVSFDPPAAKAEDIKKAVDLAKSKYNSSQGESSKKFEQVEIVEFLEEKKNLYIEGSKTSKAFKEDAAVKKEQVIAALKKTIARKYKSLNPSGDTSIKVPVMEGTVRTMAANRRLQFATAVKAYEEVGFVIEKPIENLKDKLPKFTSESNFRSIQEKISSVRELKKFYDPRFSGREQVTDIYSMMAYLKGEVYNSEFYKDQPTGNLAVLAKQLQADFPGSTGDDTVSLYFGIVSLAEQYIFKSDEMRRSYELYMVYHNKELEDLYKELKANDNATKHDQGYAEECIAVIANYFPDHGTASAIYNKEAGIINDPYTSYNRYHIKCANCGLNNTFESEIEAKARNKCTNCGSPLFKVCEVCGELVPRTLFRCSKGHSFPNKEAFKRYSRLTEAAVKAAKLDEARNYFSKMQSADPYETTVTETLRKLIDEETAKYQAPLRQLDAFISDKAFMKVMELAGKIALKYPSLNIADKKAIAARTLENCRKSFESARQKDAQARVGNALDILNECSDYSPAIELLRMYPPGRCINLKSFADPDNNTISLRWKKTSDRGVTYTLVKKEGKKAPADLMDGTVILRNSLDLEFSDRKVQPGKVYSYSLFNERQGVCSEPVSVSTAVLAKVSNIKYKQVNNTVHFDWQLPLNCDGVVVTKAVEGRESTVDERARNNTDDANPSFGKRHVYYFSAIYDGLGLSERASVDFTPTVSIGSFPIQVSKADDNYRVKWNISQKNIDLKVFVNDKEAAQTYSDAQYYDLRLPSGGFYKVMVKALSGGNWVPSQNTAEINTFAPCGFDAVIEENEKVSRSGDKFSRISITIRLTDEIPAEADRFLFFVKAKNSISDRAPWVTEEQASDKRMTGRYEKSKTALLKEGKVVCQLTAKEEDAYYITGFTVYKTNGREVISAPFKKRLKRELRADVFWKVTRKGFFAGENKLILDVEANRPFFRFPEMVLLMSSEGRPRKLDDPDSEKVLSLEEKSFDDARQEFHEECAIDCDIGKGRAFALFEVNPVQKENFSLRWAKGFEGKV